MELIPATYQLLLRHSSLAAQDGVLLGASSQSQLESNLSACSAVANAADLPADTLAAFDQARNLFLAYASRTCTLHAQTLHALSELP